MKDSFVTLGDRLPDVKLPDLDGVPHALSGDQRNKLLLFMWASW